MTQSRWHSFIHTQSYLVVNYDIAIQAPTAPSTTTSNIQQSYTFTRGKVGEVSCPRTQRPWCSWPSEDRTADPPNIGQPALPPEPRSVCTVCTQTHLHSGRFKRRIAALPHPSHKKSVSDGWVLSDVMNKQEGYTHTDTHTTQHMEINCQKQLPPHYVLKFHTLWFTNLPWVDEKQPVFTHNTSCTAFWSVAIHYTMSDTVGNVQWWK